MFPGAGPAAWNRHQKANKILLSISFFVKDPRVGNRNNEKPVKLSEVKLTLIDGNSVLRDAKVHFVRAPIDSL